MEARKNYGEEGINVLAAGGEAHPKPSATTIRIGIEDVEVSPTG
jgi:hypothetical protein